MIVSKNKYETFIFKDYIFNKENKSLILSYSFDNKINFNETYTFDFDFVEYQENVLDRAIQNLFFMAGVSYYKAYLTNNIKIEVGHIDDKLANFLSKTYQKGLGEYFYLNKLDPKSNIPFYANIDNIQANEATNNRGLLIGIGGGKDSLVTVEMLRHKNQVSTWSLGHKQQLTKLIKRIGLTHYWVDRKIDPLLLDLNDQDALNGHIPLSAILACTGTIVAILSGNKDVVVSNENSANESTLLYQNTEINHQYSKSIEFEKDYQDLLTHCFKSTLRYYSWLRPYSEIKIAQLFSDKIFDKYKDVFSSCNRAFIQSSSEMRWCKECPKCAFTYLALYNFINENELIKIFDHNLLLDPKLEITYQNLLGISGDKPLDCVGEIKESRYAMRLAQQRNHELNKYTFDIPEEYKYDNLAEDAIPEDLK